DSKIRLLPGLEQEYYYDLYKAKSSINYIADRIENAKKVFRHKNAFYDINALSNARNILKQAQTIISTACFPTGHDLTWPMNTRLQRSIEDINKITQDKENNPFLELYKNHLLPYIIEQNPDVIGISMTVDGQLIPSLTLSRLIKSSYQKAHTVVGGCIITLLSDILNKYPELFNIYFDSAILNEGERPLLKLIETLSEKKSLKDVPNLVYHENGHIISNNVEPAEDINSLPTPCFDGLPFELYLNPELVLPILSSRGCYWGKCAFCSHMKSYQWHYKNRDAKKIADDIQELSHKYNVRNFAFSDESISPSSMNKITDEIINRNINIRCSSNVRLERQFTSELCGKIYKAGFKLLYFGLESGCNRVLNHMQKGTTKETAAEVCTNAYNAGIWNHVYCFLGFPTESMTEAQETINFLLSNKNIIHSFNLDNFILSKGTDVLSKPEKYGVESIDTSTANDFNFAYNYTVSSGLTSQEALELSILSRNKIAEEYKSNKFFKLECEDVLLYITHFEKSDPFLRTASQTENKNIQIKGLTQKSMPKTKRNVILEKINFDILEITYNIINHKTAPKYPRKIYTIFDPVSGKLWSINEKTMSILKLCDGKTNIQQIADKLANESSFNLTVDDCIAELQNLYKEGYIVI
ncbi:MAG: radical SAM protein, partial [Eubacteriales bacterium]